MLKGPVETPREIALEKRTEIGERLYSPSTGRNRDVIRDVVVDHMPTAGDILEVGGGTGEHAVHLAAALPGVQWHTGDPDPAARASIAAWIVESRLANLHGPHAIDVTASDWGVEQINSFDGLVSINMIHIAPFTAAKGLFAGAGRLLRPGGKLFLYGPFSRNGAQTSPSNEAFDASLKTRNPDWGIRDLERDLTPLAEKHALMLEQVVDMPANNLSLILRKT
jgi:SAM-dependent methyltransferase